MQVEKAFIKSWVRNIFSNVLAAFVMLCPLVTGAQDIRFEHLNTDNGLSQNSVWAIAKDNKGFMWFGTDDGLNRYDGYEFIVYRNNPNDSLSISSNAITSFFQDSKNRLWIGTKNGLNLYQNTTNTFQSYYSDDGDFANLVKTICEDDNHVLWVGTGQGLKLIDTIQHKLIPFQSKNSNAKFLEETSIRNMIYKKGLWLASDSGLIHFDEKRGDLMVYSPDGKNLPKNRLTALSLHENAIWAGSFENGFYVFDLNTKIFTTYSQAESKSLISNEVTKVMIINGKAWICTPFGLSIFDLTTKTFRSFVQDKNDPTSLSNSSASDILFDDQGLVWIGTRFGINVYSNAINKFQHLKQNAGSTNTLPENNICAITENDKGEILIATDGGGVAVFNPSTKQFTTIAHDPDNANSLSGNKTLSLLYDSKGGLWIGTWGTGLNYYDAKTKRFQHFLNKPGDEHSLSSNNIFRVIEDSDGDIWVCLWGGSICKIDNNTKKITRLNGIKGYPELDSYSLVMVNAFQDKQGLLWFGAQEGGVYQYNKKSGGIKKYSNVRKDSTSISISNATVFFEDGKGRFWIGTDGGGLNLFNRETETFKRFRMVDGLPNDVILGILEDNNGHLWISTNNGLARVKVVTNDQSVKLECHVFDKGDGLQGNQFSRWAYYKSKKDFMFFGGNNGFNMFHPDNILTNEFIPPVVITSFALFNKTVMPGAYNSPLTSSITETKTITLEHDQSVLSFEFAALNFVHPEKNQYSFYLQNFDKEWNQLNNQRKATYTNLDPGEYEFIVKASNNDGVWNVTGTSIQLIILPPYWQTTWFRILMGIVAVLIIYAIFRIRLNYLIHQKYELARQVRQRTDELEIKNTELVEKVEEIKTQNETLSVQKSYIAEKNNAIIAQNEELRAQKDHISEQREELEITQAKLQRMNERLELLVSDRTNKLKDTIKELDKTVMELDRLVYSASHELTAPLKSIRGLIHLGEIENNPERIKEYNRYIEISITKLEKVIESLVEFSRNSNLQVKNEFIDLHQLANEVIGGLVFWPEAGKVSIHNNIPERFGIKSDQQRLKTVFQNLIGNGIRYADTGKSSSFITIECVEKDGAAWLTFSDNGIGISVDSVPHIFNMYYRGTQKSDGSGLGLFIVREIVNKLKGGIAVSSISGEGTIFTIKLPLSNHVVEYKASEGTNAIQ